MAFDPLSRHRLAPADGTLEVPSGVLPGGRGRVLSRTVPRPSLSAVMAALLGVLLVVPIGAFLLVAVSPRSFAQGNSWLTLAPFGEALSGPSLRALGRHGACRALARRR